MAKILEIWMHKPVFCNLTANTVLSPTRPRTGRLPVTNPLLNVVIMHCYWCSLSFLAHLPAMRPYKSEATPILCGGQPYNFLEHMTKCAVVPVSDHGGDLFYGMS